jgi:type I restriction enzyme S subunit
VVGSGGPNGTHHSPSTSGPGVVIGRSGAGFGSAWWCEDDFWALNTGLFVSNFRQNHPKFVYYLLDFLDFSTFNSGGAQPSLNRSTLRDISTRFPSVYLYRRFAEQRKIAEILHTWDDAIQRSRNTDTGGNAGDSESTNTSPHVRLRGSSWIARVIACRYRTRQY